MADSRASKAVLGAQTPFSRARVSLAGLLVLASAIPAFSAVIASWQFNEKAPGLAASPATGAVLDDSGNNRPLTASGSPLPQYTNGAANYSSTSALHFTSGTDQLYTSETAPFNFGLTDSFTLEAVLRTAPGANFTGCIIGRDWGSKLPSWWFRIEAGAPRFLIAQNGGPEPNVTANVLVNDGNWHHVAAVRDAANKKLRVYVDYALAGEAADSLTAPPTNSQNLVIGAFNGGTRQFEGDMDFVRVSGGALSPEAFAQPNLAQPFTTNVFVAGQDGYNTFRIPALLATSGGTLLAFCEGRKNSASDAGDIDLVLRRSLDAGNTWSPLQLVYSDGTNTVGNPCPVLDQDTGIVWLPFCRNNDRVYVTFSRDAGLTWATPWEITNDVKPPGWAWYATGPGVGIQLGLGPHKGRLVIPCDHTSRDASNNLVQSSHVIYSDDHGWTWQLGGSITPQMNECQVAELADGELMMNMRNADAAQDQRAISTSGDSGLTWSAVWHDPALIEPICQASLLRYTLAAQLDRNRLLFSNPASTTSRRNLTVRLSYDEGATWPSGKLVYPGPSAYSCLAVLPELTLGCLYEAGVSSPYETIRFSRFSLPWLTDGADTPNRRELQARLAGGSFSLSWPAVFSNAALQASADLRQWSDVAVARTLTNGQCAVTLDTLSAGRFFRLHWTNEIFNSQRLPDP